LMWIIRAVNYDSGASSKLLLLTVNTFEILWRHVPGSVNLNKLTHMNWRFDVYVKVVRFEDVKWWFCPKIVASGGGLRYLRFFTGVLISPQSDQKGNKLQQQKILSFIYPIYNHNWRNISNIYIRGLEL